MRRGARASYLSRLPRMEGGVAEFQIVERAADVEKWDDFLRLERQLLHMSLPPVDIVRHIAIGVKARRERCKRLSVRNHT
jgi:hypothetical protein